MNGEKIDLHFTVNGTQVNIPDVWYFESLLNVIRDRLGLTGSKYACDNGFCGACTMEVDGEIINSCVELAAHCDGSDIRTIEGANDTTSQAVQEALIHTGDVQCGYCMPGMVMAASHLIRASDDLAPEDVREKMSGNYCRCTGYARIVDAICQAKEVSDDSQ